MRRRALPCPALALAALAVAGCPTGEPQGELPRPEAPAPRVITPSPALAEMVFAVGGAAHLVGVSRYCLEPPECRELPRIGGMLDPNLEAIDALAPDAVLVQGRMEQVEALAARRGFAVEVFEIESLADVLAALRRTGALLDRAEAGEAAARRLEDALAAARVARPERRPRTLLVYGHRPGELTQVSTAGAGTFISECLEAAGGEGCADDLPAAWPVLAPEVVVEKAPELIVELHTEPVDAATAAALRADWAAFPDVPAVREGRIAIVCGDELLVPGPRLDRAVAKLARAVGGELDVGWVGQPGSRPGSAPGGQ